MKVRLVKDGQTLVAGGACYRCGDMVGEKIPTNAKVTQLLKLASAMGLDDFDRTFDVPGLHGLCTPCKGEVDGGN